MPIDAKNVLANERPTSKTRKEKNKKQRERRTNPTANVIFQPQGHAKIT